MPPRSKYDRPVANRVFTNREGPIAAFDAARAGLPADRHRLLTYYGIGGQGKTALCKHLIARLAAESPPRHLWGLLDLDIADHRDPARGLLEIRKGLHASGAIRTPVFDLAIATYWSSAYATEDIDRALKDVLRDNRDLISAVADAAPGWAALAVQDAGVPGLGLLVRGVAHARRLLKERGAKRACEALVDLEHLSAAQILDRLPWFLGQDLIAHRADPGAPTPICFIDTYEALWSEHPDKAGPAALETDAWVRELVAAAPGTLFVILGRERLSWDRRFPDDWGDLLGDQHLLGGLADADADRFLAAIPIPDGAVRRALIAGAKADPGLCSVGPGPDGPAGAGPDPGAAVPQTPGPGDCGAHPFYLDLSVDTYLDLIDAGHTPVPDDFGRTHPEILARFMRHRTPTERETLKVLAGPRAFDRTLFAALMERFRTRYSEGRFNDLVGYSFCEPGPDGRYRLHALMREHLLEELDPETRAALDAFLFDWFDARCQPARPREVTAEHEAALREAVHHRGTGDAEAALDWFWGAAAGLSRRGPPCPAGAPLPLGPGPGGGPAGAGAPRDRVHPQLPRPTAPGHQPPG